MNLFRLTFSIGVLLISITSEGQKRKLVWSDEFNYHGLPDSTKWSYDTGGNGWGNRELEYYTSKKLANARVVHGMLVIEARKEPYKGMNYTSARLVTKNKGDWQYGRIEVKAKIPKGKGMWPAIWMLPTKDEYGGWPHSGEIDIMENVGYMPDSVFGSIHTGAFNHTIGTQKTKGIYLSDLATGFHVYAIEWNENQISFFVDSRKYLEFQNDHMGSEHWPFDKAFHLILNIAVGGNWGGKYGVDNKIFPQRMEVDWVRVYQ
ncbi:MAG: family 16 glycosylhydrolase [Flavisolibacter sp.]